MILKHELYSRKERNIMKNVIKYRRASKCRHTIWMPSSTWSMKIKINTHYNVSPKKINKKEEFDDDDDKYYKNSNLMM